MTFQSWGRNYHVELSYSKALKCWVIDRLIVDRSDDQTWETYQFGAFLTPVILQCYHQEIEIAKSLAA